MAYKIKSAVVCLDPPCHTVFYPVIQSEAKDLGFLASTFISS